MSLAEQFPAFHRTVALSNTWTYCTTNKVPHSGRPESSAVSETCCFIMKST